MNPYNITYIILAILTLVTVFHLGILTRIIPFENVWGGRLKSVSQMVKFEILSIAVNLVLIVIVLMKVGFVNAFIPMNIIDGSFWLFVALFGLNTVGNLMAKTNFEKYFAIVTLMLAILLGLLI